MAVTARRPLAFWRLDAAGSALGIGAAVNSGVAPAKGFEAMTVWMRLVQAGTLEIQQRLRASSTWVTTNTYALPGAGVVSDAVLRSGELVRAVFTNGGVAQTPELILELI